MSIRRSLSLHSLVTYDFRFSSREALVVKLSVLSMRLQILDDFDDARATGAGHTRCPDQAPGPLADGGAAAAGVRSLVDRLTSELNSAWEEREKAEKRARSAHSLVMKMKADHKTQELSWKRRKQTWDNERKSHKRRAVEGLRALAAAFDRR